MRFDLCLSTTNGKVKAGRFSTVSLSSDELQLMRMHLASSPISICEQVEEKEPAPQTAKVIKKPVKKVVK